MTMSLHQLPRAVATVASVATHGHVATVAPVASAAPHGHVATLASLATRSPGAGRRASSVATLATCQIAVATANPLMKQGSGHTFHSGHSLGTNLGTPPSILPWRDVRRGRASILSSGSGKCGKCGHCPVISKTYQWPHEIAMWQLWPQANFGRHRAHIRICDEVARNVMVKRVQRRARDPPPRSIAAVADDDGQLRQEPGRRRPDHDHPL
jgi:hypothetical protein